MVLQNEFLEKVFSLNNKVVIVTGAAGQIGSSLVSTLIKLGSKVVAVDISIEQLKKSSLKNEWDKDTLLLSCDITSSSEISKVFIESSKKFGTVSALVNNAAVSVFEPFLERKEVSIDNVMDVNIKGTILLMMEFLKYKKKSKDGGVVVNLASHYGIISPDPRIYSEGDRKNSEVYGATKAGIIQMTKYYAVHASEFDVRINSVSPGGVFNPENPQGDYFLESYNFRCPMKRMAKTEEIVNPILFLLSSASNYINGHNLVVDGGMSIW